MRRTYIYPYPFFPILTGIVCFICFYIAILPEIATVVTLLLTAAGLLTLCTTFYVFPIISFDDQQIYIFRFLPGTAKRIRQYSTKASFISICTRQYQYRYIMMGYLLPKEILIRLQAAGISIE